MAMPGGLCFTYVLFVLADAGSLRGPAVSVEEVEKNLFEELASTFRAGDVGHEDHVARLEGAFHKMYAAAPQQSDGTLTPTVVRYILHRFFVKEHGWNIRGLEPGTSAMNISAGYVVSNNSMQIGRANMSFQQFQDWVPAYLQRFMAQLHKGKDLNLHEVAVIASTLESLVHKEAVSYLERAYSSMEIPFSELLNSESAREILDIWLMIFILGGRFNIKGKAKATKAHTYFVKKLKDWGSMQDWVHQLQVDFFPQDQSNKTIDFNMTSSALCKL
jgi:hypothetical protein